MKGLLELLDILFSIFCTVVFIFLAGLVSALYVEPSPRGDTYLELFNLTVFFSSVIYFPLTILLITEIDQRGIRGKIKAVENGIKEKISERRIKTNRVEKVAGSLSLPESGDAGNLSFSEAQGALSEVKNVRH